MENKKSNMGYYLRILAGAYICYIGVELIIGLINGRNTMNPALAIIFALVFVGCGAYFAVSSVMYLYKHRNDTVAPSADDDMEDLEAEEKRLEEMKDETVEEAQVEKAEELVEKAKETLEEKLERLKDKDMEEVLAEKDGEQ